MAKRNCTAYRRGMAGEELVCRWLQRRGYSILERNFRARRGEIDIVAQQGSTIVFVEVKTRTGAVNGQGMLAVGPVKRRRLVKAAQAWLVSHPFAAGMVCRFDVVEVELRAGEALLRHIKEAFEPETL